ncbi:MAG: phage terminase large subunit [Acidobacteria bacterium]|nr:phage terminase large subunit [Acidobacteriota bacterium]
MDRAPGQALCPERFDEAALERIRRKLGSYSFSALYQQRPTPLDGGLFKRRWFDKIIDRRPANLRWCRGYDLAVSISNSADYTASFRCAFDNQGNLYIADGFRERIEFPEQRRFIVDKMLTETSTRHCVEKALHGAAIVQDLRREPSIRHIPLTGVRVDNDKFTRALAWSSLAEDGKVILVRGAWNDAFIHEACAFPNSTHDDQIDAISLAVKMLSTRSSNVYGF